MGIEKFVRNLGFALAAVGVVLGLGATFEYVPVINALAR
jgi:SNF family Na+-dependent transporter